MISGTKLMAMEQSNGWVKVILSRMYYFLDRLSDILLAFHPWMHHGNLLNFVDNNIKAFKPITRKKKVLSYHSGLWATLDVLKLLGLDAESALELQPLLLESSSADDGVDPLLKMVINGQTDFTPLEFVINQARQQILGETMEHFCIRKRY